MGLISIGDEAPNFDLSSTEDALLMLRDEVIAVLDRPLLLRRSADDRACRDLDALNKQPGRPGARGRPGAGGLAREARRPEEAPGSSASSSSPCSTTTAASPPPTAWPPRRRRSPPPGPRRGQQEAAHPLARQPGGLRRRGPAAGPQAPQGAALADRELPEEHHQPADRPLGELKLSWRWPSPPATAAARSAGCRRAGSTAPPAGCRAGPGP